MSIYFIQCTFSGRIKIGYTDNEVGDRFSDIRRGGPTRMILLGSIPGSAEKEAALHRRMREQWVGGVGGREWFAPEGEVLVLLNEIGLAVHTELTDLDMAHRHLFYQQHGTEEPPMWFSRTPPKQRIWSRKRSPTKSKIPAQTQPPEQPPKKVDWVLLARLSYSSAYFLLKGQWPTRSKMDGPDIIAIAHELELIGLRPSPQCSLDGLSASFRTMLAAEAELRKDAA